MKLAALRELNERTRMLKVSELRCSHACSRRDLLPDHEVFPGSRGTEGTKQTLPGGNL